MKSFAAIAGCALFAGSSLATISTYSDRALFEAEFGDLLTLQDFEGFAPAGGSIATPPIPDFSVESGTDFGMAWGVTDASPAPSAVLFQFNADDRLIITFPYPMSVVGFQISCVDFFDVLSSGDAFVRAYDSFDNTLHDVTIGTAPISSMSTFFGIVDSNVSIARIEVGDAPLFAGYVTLDDFAYYGVPGPGGAAIVGIGAAAVATRRRR